MSEINPTLGDVLDTYLERYLKTVHVMLPGTIEKIWKAECAVDVQPSITRPVPDVDGKITEEKIAIIPRVPLAFLGLGPFAVTMPVQRGQRVMVIFADRGIAKWALSGKVSGAPDYSYHGTQGAVAVPGLVPFSEAWKFDDTAMLVGKNGGPFDWVPLATDVKARLDAIQAAFDSHTHLHSPGPSPPAPTAPPLQTIGPIQPIASTSVKVSK